MQIVSNISLDMMNSGAILASSFLLREDTAFLFDDQEIPNVQPQILAVVLDVNQNVITSDWIILADMKHDYLFPFQLVLTELHPDILLFSKSSKRAVQLELTCPCEENLESWQSQKLNKYTTLAKVIEYSGWAVDIFAIELGAQG